MTVKRIAICIVGFVLLAAVIFATNIPQPVTIGKGDGTNTKVETLPELRGVLRAFSGSDMPFGSYSLAEEGGGAAEHTSVTITITSDQTLTSSSSGDSSQSEQEIAFQRTLLIAVTEDAVYYETEGRLISKSSDYSSSPYSGTTSTKEKFYYDFSFSFYLSSERALVRAERLDMRSSYDRVYTDRQDPAQNTEEHTENDLLGDDVFTAVKEHPNTWIDCSAHTEMMSVLFSVNEMNMETLSSFDILFAEAESDDTVFEQKGDRYILSDERLREMLGVPAEEEMPDEDDPLSFLFNGNVIADLTAADAPCLSVNASIQASASAGEARSKSSAISNDVFLFENIDNTVIRLSDKLEPIPLNDILATEEA